MIKQQFYTFYKLLCRSVRTFIKNNLFIITSAFAILILYTWLFRAQFYELVGTVYPGLFSFSFRYYLFISLPNDTITVFAISVIGFPLLFMPQRFRILKYCLAGLIIELYLLTHFAGIAYFRIFETQLTFKLLNTGLNTFWKELFHSIKSEIPYYQYIILLIHSLILILILKSLYNRPAKSRQTSLNLPLYKAKTNTKTIYMSFSFIMFIFLSALVQMHTTTGAINKNTAPGISQLCANPMSILLYHTFLQQSVQNKPIDTSVDLTDFHFGLNSDSLVLDKKFPGINIDKDRKYNIIFYVFESTAHSYLNYKVNNVPITRTWKKLAKNSLVFNNHYAHYPLSVNSLFSVFASAYDHPNKTWIAMSHPHIPIKTVSELLKQKGYKNAVLQSGNIKGFGHYRFLKHRGYDFIIDIKNLKKSGYKLLTPTNIDERAMIKPAVQFIKKNKGKPFFMAFFPTAPHHPYSVPSKKYKIYKNIHSEISRKTRRWMNYINALHYADACLGELVSTLEKEQMMEDTLLFVFADHGEAFYQHKQNYLHSFFLYEENVHVPFLVYNKKLFPGTQYYNGISRHIDIMPTVLDIVGIKPEKVHEGISLFAPHTQQLALLHTSFDKDFSGLRDGKWKYIKNLNNGFRELYDLSIDPAEKNNVAENHQELTSRFEAYINQARHYKKQYFTKILSKSGKRIMIAPRKTNKRLPMI